MVTTLNKELKETYKAENNLESKNITLISKHEYRTKIREHLTEEDLKPDAKHLMHYAAGFTTVLLGMYLVSSSIILPIKLLATFAIGIALVVLTFFLHDVMHGSIVRSDKLSYLLGFTVGIFNLFPVLFWKRVHNFHHATTGDICDPDRSYIKEEQPKNLIEKFAYKTRLSFESFHPIISLIVMSSGFFFYFGNNLMGAFIPQFKSRENDKFNRVHALLKTKEKFIVIFEILSICAFQYFLFSVVFNYSILNYVLGSAIPILICHFIAMSYIHTNHFLSPLTGKIDDPLINSLSLQNSAFVDKIFSNFSHHVEHHLFPVMSSSKYPKVRKILYELYPERFQVIPMIDAMKLLLKTPRIYNNYTTLVSVDGSEETSCLLPS